MLVPASARIVGLRLRSRFNVADWASERLYGIEHLFFLRDLARRVEEDWPSVLADMERLRIALINRDNLIVNVTADRATLAASADAIGRLVDSLPARRASHGVSESAVNADAGTSWIDDALAACGPSVLRPGFETLELPTQVNSVGMVLPLQNLNQAAGAVYVASKYLDAVYLWGQVRVMGGAYGGYSSLDLASGLLLLLSYRDPNLERTIEVYRKVSNYLKSATVSDEEIHRAIIGTIGEVDAYQLPDAKGFNALMNELTGYTQEVRQTIRNQILATDADAFRRLGAMIEEAMQRSMMVVLSAPERIDKALQTLPVSIERLSV